MSDYCKGCHYDRKQRIGECACPYNALYWDFFRRNAARLSGNHRLGMVYRQLQRMTRQDIGALEKHAARLKTNLAAL